MLTAEANRPDANINIMKNLIQRGAAVNTTNGAILLAAVQNLHKRQCGHNVDSGGRVGWNAVTPDSWRNTALIEVVSQPASQLSLDLLQSSSKQEQR